MQHTGATGPATPPPDPADFGPGVLITPLSADGLGLPGRSPRRWIIVQFIMIAGLIGGAMLIRENYPSRWLYWALAVAWLLVPWIASRLRGTARTPASPAQPLPDSPSRRAGTLAALCWIGAFTLLLACGNVAAGSPWDVALFELLIGPTWLLVLLIPAQMLLLPSGTGVQLTCLRCGHKRFHWRPSVSKVVPGCSHCHLPWTLPPEVLRLTHLTPADLFRTGAFFACFLIAAVVGHYSARLIPTPTLLRILAASGSSADHAWRQLDSRALTPEQSAQVVTLLTERRDRGFSIPWAADQWLSRNLHQARSNPATFARHFREWFDLGLARVGTRAAAPGDPPMQVSAGERVQVYLDITTYDRDMSGHAPLIYIEGFWEGDAWETRQHAQTLGLYSVGWEYSDEQRRRRQTSMTLRAPHAEFLLDTPGQTTITAAVWLVVPANRAATPEITWNPDGTLNAPDALFVERREMTIPITVR